MIGTKTAVLDHGYIQTVETWGSEEQIIEAARMSTNKGFLGWGDACELCSLASDRNVDANPPCPECGGRRRMPEAFEGGKKVGKPGDEKLLRFLWENQHHTPFEMAGATFEVEAPIMVFREWFRHRLPFGYNELSARYAPLPNSNYSPTVERLLRNSKTNKQAGTITGAAELNETSALEWLSKLESSYETAEAAYQAGLQAGVPKELARLCVPVGRYSRMRATGNLRGWLGFLKLRMAPNAQEEIRVYAHALCEMLTKKFPRTIGLFKENGAA